MRRASAPIVALGISLLAGGGTHAAVTGKCNGTALTGFENRTPLSITDIRVSSASNFDFGRTVPTSLPPYANGGVKQSDGLIQNSYASWTITQRMDQEAKATMQMVLVEPGGEKIQLSLKYATEDSGGKWKPNVGKLMVNIGKIGIGVAKGDATKIIEGSLYAVDSIAKFTELSHGLKLEPSASPTTATGKFTYEVEKNTKEATFVHINKSGAEPEDGYALVILPVPSNCMHAGWRVALMNYYEFIHTHQSFE